jgi:predicted transcriptional regulator
MSMKKHPVGPKALTKAQLAVMNVIWERGEATTTEVWEALRVRRRLARNTIQTTITRLEEKGWLSHREIGRTFLYRAVAPRTATLGRMMRQFVETAFDGSAEGLVMALLQDPGLSSDEARRIRDMIDKAERDRRE